MTRHLGMSLRDEAASYVLYQRFHVFRFPTSALGQFGLCRSMVISVPS